MSSKNNLPDQEGQEEVNLVAVPSQDDKGGFQRGRIVWGRPPEVVFRAGPLPRDEGMARLMAMGPHPQPKGPSVKGSVAAGNPMGGGGSNIPQAARPAGAAAPVQPAQPQSAAPKPARQPAPLGGFSNVPMPRREPAPKPVASPEVLKPVAEAEPVRTEPVQPAVAHEEPMSVLEPVVAKRKPQTVTAEDAVIVPAARTTQASSTKSSSRKFLWLAGAAVVAIAGAVLWLNREPAPSEPVMAPVETAPSETAPLAETSPVEAIEPEAAAPATPEPTQPAPVASAQTPAKAPAAAPQTRTPTSTPAPVATAPRAPAPAAPVVRTPEAVVVQAPVAQPPAQAPVVQAPVAQDGPPPTQAERQNVDPDGPVVTRPQKLD